jgi:hypothetical protein
LKADPFSGAAFSGSPKMMFAYSLPFAFNHRADAAMKRERRLSVFGLVVVLVDHRLAHTDHRQAKRLASGLPAITTK